MLKLSDHLYIEPMGRVIEHRRETKKMHKRYAGARPGRLHSGWTTQPQSANFTLRRDLRILRARSRDMTEIPFVKKYLSMCRSNIIGQNGIQLQVRARNADTTLNADLNKRVEMAFWDWSYAETCTVSGKLDWLAAQRLFVTQLARDGEVLVQKVAAKNAFGFALKFIDVSYLDENLNRLLPNGNRILMSVEVDSNDKPVAYWLTPPPTDLEYRPDLHRHPVRVPAEEMIHSFLVLDDESQTRGVPWLYAVMVGGKSLASYVDSVVVASRVGAMNLGFIEEEISEDGTGWEGDPEDADGVRRTPEIDFSPGGFTELRPGQKVTSWKPDQPTQNHSAFKKSMEMDAATGLDVPYFDLFGDMEAVNFSSARVGLNQSRDIWRYLQDFVATAFCREVYHAWLPNALLSGKLKVKAAEYEQIRNPIWRPRGWRHIDPQKEVTADVTALENKLTTWTDVLAERGIDLVDHLETLKQERELAAGYGIDLSIAVKTPQIAAPPDEEDDDDDDKETDDEQPPPKRKAYTNGHARVIG